jgi:hypothetical protein
VRRFLAGLGLMLGSASGAVASGELLQPLAVRNLSPFLGIYGIPAMEAPVVTAAGVTAVHLQLDVASHFTDATNDRELIVIDGETHRLALRFARGLGNRLEIGAELPLISHSGGFLDGLINEWHELFGLPTLGRDRVENGLLRFRYDRDGQVLVDERASGTGIGDVLLFAGKTLERSGSSTLTLRGQVKLPTGDAERLRGSGGVDAAISAALSGAPAEKWTFSGRLGAAYLGRADVLPDLQRRWAVFGTAFAGWRAFRTVSLKAQLDVLSPLHANSGIDQLTDTTVQLSLGASVRIGKRSFLDFGVTEDELNPDVSSDVAFQIRLRTAR